MSKLAIIGGGFMGGALAEGLLDAGWHRDSFVVAEVSRDRRETLQHLRVRTTERAEEAARSASTVLIAVKPQSVGDTLAALAPAWRRDQLCISICAGIRVARFEAALGEGTPVIRTMPNTPAAVGMGVTALARGRWATDQHLATALNVMSAVGRVAVVAEDQMDAVTAVSGSGPAYVFYLAESLITAAMEQGLDHEQAHLLVYQTFLGAAHLLSHDGAGPAELRRRVTSPNGTTHAAIRHLEQAGWADTFREAVAQAKQRAEALGR